MAYSTVAQILYTLCSSKTLNHAHFDEPLSKSVAFCFRTGVKKVGMSIQLKGLFLHDFLTRRFSFCSFMKCIFDLMQI